MKRDFYDCVGPDGTPVTVTADSHQRAAVRYAEQVDLGAECAESPAAVRVRKRGESELRRFALEWQSEVIYRAREVK